MSARQIKPTKPTGNGNTSAGGDPPRDGPAGSRVRRSALLGAMFLMATSAIGPGFVTQTTVFTARLGAAFAFAIVVSTLLDIAVQMNVWRVVGVSGSRAQDLANRIVPGAGYVLAALVVIGGLIFNIANVGGTGLGTASMLGLDPRIGGAVSAVIAIGIFVSRCATSVVDRVVVLLGFVMIALTVYVVIVSGPPIGEAARQAVAPDTVNFFIITTLIGGTVGGYITYAGAHRLVDSGVKGPEQAATITRSSVTGILITALMRALLFLAVLGVVAAGVTLSEQNPTASAFGAAAGAVGVHIFGVVLWAAAMTSVIGASYTSVSFLKTFSPLVARRENLAVIAFIVVSAAGFLLLGQEPVTLLIFAGAVNGLILPVGFGIVLWVAARRRDLLHGYRYPRWLLILGILVWALSIYLAWNSLEGLAQLWQ